MFRLCCRTGMAELKVKASPSLSLPPSSSSCIHHGLRLPDRWKTAMCGSGVKVMDPPSKRQGSPAVLSDLCV
jgi:hypothetical protein